MQKARYTKVIIKKKMVAYNCHTVKYNLSFPMYWNLRLLKDTPVL